MSGRKQDTRDVEDLRDLQRLDAVRLKGKRGTGDLSRIENTRARPSAKRFRTQAEKLADGREHEHAAHTPEQDGTDRVGNLRRLGLHHRCGGNRRGHAADSDASRQHTAHRVGHAHQPSHPQHQADRAQHKDADQGEGCGAKMQDLLQEVEGAQKYDAGLEPQP
jgi:hypothetical protein